MKSAKRHSKICFINTPTQLYSSSKGCEIENYSTIPPLGLGYVATAASGIVTKDNVSLIDAEFLRLSPRKIVQSIIDDNPDYIAINASTPNFHIVKIIIVSLRRVMEKKIIIGGAHAILSPNSILQDKDIRDLVYCVCIGDGEPTIIDLLKGKKLSQIANIKYIDKNNDIVKSKKEETTQSINKIIDRTFFQNDPLEDGDKIESFILSARGCPFRCSFCAAPMMKPKMTKRDDDSMKQELMELRAQGVNYIRFVDDLFLSSKKRVDRLKQIWNDLKLNKENFGFEATARINIASKFSKETWELLVKMGLKEIEIGIESGSQRIIRMMAKNINNQEVVSTVKMAISQNIKVKGFVMLGYPTETVLDLNITLDLIKKLKRLGGGDIRFSPVIVKAYPGTDIYSKYSHLVDNLSNDYLIDLADYFSDEFTDDEKKILKKRTRYNAVHTLNEIPVALSEITGGAKLYDVLQVLAKLTLLSENQIIRH